LIILDGYEPDVVTGANRRLMFLAAFGDRLRSRAADQTPIPPYSADGSCMKIMQLRGLDC